jgi:AbrB family looped-hinge helix DNA binding protein
MEKIGVKKEIDKLGRVCIPKDMRKLFNIDGEVELQITKEGILIKNPGYILVKLEECKTSEM